VVVHGHNVRVLDEEGGHVVVWFRR
jgi:hypothetical protein